MTDQIQLENRQLTHELNNLSRHGQISRRDFLQIGIAMGVSLSTASAIWSKSAAAAQQGGHAVFGVTDYGSGDSLNPVLQSTDHVNLVRNALRNTLVELTPTGELEGDLAESWGSSKDVTEWTFTLRNGVEFHNGKPLTPQDVIDSLNMHRGENSKSGGKSLLDAVEEIKADGPNQLKISLNAGNADFPYYLTQFFFLICPSEGGVVDTDSGNGTGPFSLETFEPGVRGVVKRNPNYHKDGLPYFDSVEALAIKDPASRTNALVTGQVHAIDNVDLKTTDHLQKTPGVSLVSVESATHRTGPMDMTAAPFDNNDVRLALKHAFDREDMVNRVMRGYATIGNDHPIASSSPFFNSELPQRVYDPDKARFHLKQAGFTSLDIDLHASDGVFAGSIDTAVVFKETAAAAGLNVNLIQEPADGYWSNVWKNVPFCFAYWNGRPTADLMFTTAYFGEAKWNDTNFKNDRFDTLLVAARTEPDFAIRRDMYWEMQEILHNDGGVIIPAFVNYLYGISDQIGHDQIGGTRGWDKMRATERWWMKA